MSDAIHANVSKHSVTHPIDKLQVVMLSLEGPDRYSNVGGLGVRAAELGVCLASLGYETHLYFVGDPDAPYEEDYMIKDDPGAKRPLKLHRWCQWLSAIHRGGVYDGEEEKMNDLRQSWPEHVIKEHVLPGKERGVVTVFLIEEWQTAETAIRLGELLEANDLNDWVLSLWNANNTYGFERIDFSLLDKYAAITTVSRYMKHKMWDEGVNPMVIHNGIPRRIIGQVSKKHAERLRAQCLKNPNDIMLVKCGRFDVDKRWIMAVHAVAGLKELGFKPKFIVRGSSDYHGKEVFNEAISCGLSWTNVYMARDASIKDFLKIFEDNMGYDVIEFKTFIPEYYLNLLYASADGVLANSGHEPFGLVGLEVMANGGIAFVGSTGEDYAQHLVNSIVLETEDEREIVNFAAYLKQDEEMVRSLRANGPATAASYEWNFIAKDLLGKIFYLAYKRGVKLKIGAR